MRPGLNRTTHTYTIVCSLHGLDRTSDYFDLECLFDTQSIDDDFRIKVSSEQSERLYNFLAKQYGKTMRISFEADSYD